MTVRLVDRHPRLGAADLLARFVPPPRFASVRFSTYRPNPDHPSQAEALAAVERFAAGLAAPAEPARRRWFGRREPAAPATAPGRYLDGGFGVGKTHLLASLWHEAPAPKAYLTFAELAAVVGFLGMEAAVHAFSRHRLVCIDEFELDDVANTLMMVTFLRSVIGGGTRVAATSNTLPDRLGEGRFAADDFTREIAAIASHFEVVRIDGPDYRATEHVAADPEPDERAASLLAGLEHLDRVSHDRFGSLLVHLRQVHPVQVGALLDGIDLAVIEGLVPIANQGDALLFVHLVDELYDAGVAVRASGCAVSELFPAAYRFGGYRKKYGRCESRLGELLGAGRAR